VQRWPLVVGVRLRLGCEKDGPDTAPSVTERQESEPGLDVVGVDGQPATGDECRGVLVPLGPGDTIGRVLHLELRHRGVSGVRHQLHMEVVVVVPDGTDTGCLNAFLVLYDHNPSVGVECGLERLP